MRPEPDTRRRHTDIWEALERVGVELTDVLQVLEDEGVEKLESFG